MFHGCLGHVILSSLWEPVSQGIEVSGNLLQGCVGHVVKGSLREPIGWDVRRQMIFGLRQLVGEK